MTIIYLCDRQTVFNDLATGEGHVMIQMPWVKPMKSVGYLHQGLCWGIPTNQIIAKSSWRNLDTWPEGTSCHINSWSPVVLARKYGLAGELNIQASFS